MLESQEQLGIDQEILLFKIPTLLIVLGCRLNIRQISYNWKEFAPKAFKIMVDLDQAELDKPTLKIDYKIKADLKIFIPLFIKKIKDLNYASKKNI